MLCDKRNSTYPRLGWEEVEERKAGGSQESGDRIRESFPGNGQQNVKYETAIRQAGQG